MDSTKASLYDSDKVLIATGPGELVPYNVGVVPHQAVVTSMVVLALLWAAGMGLLIWLLIELERERPYYCGGAQTDSTSTSGYVVYQNRAAEPYCNKPSSVVTNAASAATCVSQCNSDSDCKFFTHNKDKSECYLYQSSLFPDPNQNAAVPGPTTLNADVYVKTGTRVVEMIGTLKDGK